MLGPVDVLAEDGPKPVQGLRRKAVLAALALHAGEVVGIDTLVDVVWGEAAPQTAANTLQSHVSYLRTVLGSKAAILARAPGYMLDLGPEATDKLVVERLLREGSQATDPARAVRQLQQAMALWRGRSLADAAASTWLEQQAERLDLLRTRVERALTGARLAAGEHQQLLPDLERLAHENPLDEQIHAQFMVALYRCGRQADALARYHRLRERLDEELGIEPSQPLRDLEIAILRQDPTLVVAPATPAAAVKPIPAQLPTALASFAGREAELASLDAILPELNRGEDMTGAAVIAAVSGTAGVGKTALAVWWAHQVAGRFPDGQLYVNLRGFGPQGEAVDPESALRRFLEALGMPQERIPDTVAAQTGMYRSLLAGKRVLVMLDNARDATQVRSLLPGSPGCLALVTSRDQLTGLVAVEGAHLLPLELMTSREASELLTRRLGEARMAQDPESAMEIVRSCARLPLALAVVAARAVTRPSFPLSVIADELRQATRALDPFEGGDLTSDVRAVFSWSYRALPEAAARLFRLLGLHPGPDLSVAAAASLAAIPLRQARALMGELDRAHLLSEHRPGQYAFHDLLRAYACELTEAHDRQEARDDAVARLVEHYLHTAHHAATLIEPHYVPLTLSPPRPGVGTAKLTDAEGAQAWFDAEHNALLAAITTAAASQPTQAWQLAWSLSIFLLWRGMWHQQTLACQAGLEAARRTGDVAGEAHSLNRLACGYAMSGRIAEADPLFRQSLRLFEGLGDHVSQAIVHGSLGWLAGTQDRPAESLSHCLRALDEYRAANHRAGQALVLNDVGFAYALLGNYRQALTYCRQALAATQELGARSWEVAVWDSLGYIHHRLGDYERAISCYERSIALGRQLADRASQAEALEHLGDVHLSAGDAGAAHRAWTGSLRIYDEIGHPDADALRLKLDGSYGGRGAYVTSNSDA